MRQSYKSSVVCINKLPESTIQEMVVLYLENYDGSSETIFRVDLADKDEVILLYEDGCLVGFTSLKVYEISWQDRPARIIYSGDTIVNPLHWGQQELAFAWISRIGAIKRRAPELPLFWFLLVKGHRTFKYLSVFSKSFYPHWQDQREDLKMLAEQLAKEKFGSAYDSETGIVRFQESRGHLKAVIADASIQEKKRVATNFFFMKNPQYKIGHELVCICELEVSNMKPLVARLFQHPREGICA